MSWKDEAEDGIREALSDGAGTSFVWCQKTIPCLIGNGVSYEELVSGGAVDSENTTFMVLKSDLQRIAPGKKFKQGQIIKIAGKSLKIASVSFDDPADPAFRIFTEGAEQ